MKDSDEDDFCSEITPNKDTSIRKNSLLFDGYSPMNSNLKSSSAFKTDFESESKLDLLP
jgi:hypothetical protein